MKLILKGMSSKLKAIILLQLIKSEKLQFLFDPRRRKIDWEFVQFFKENGSTYIAPEIDLSFKKYEDVTSRLRLVRKRFKSRVNTYFFQTCQSYGDQRLRFNTIYGFGIGRHFDLNPTYICFLDYVVKNKIKGNVIDFATGLGGFLPYLEKHIPRGNIYGIDNFSQITESEVRGYQQDTYGFEVNRSAPVDISYEAFFITGLPIHWITPEILKYKPNLILCDSKYFSKINTSNEAMQKLLLCYSVKKYNEIFCVLSER